MFYTSLQFLHIAAAVVWMGGMSFMLFAFRPALGAALAPSLRLPLLAGVLQRFFVMVWACVLLLLASGGFMMVLANAQALPVGWHVMAGIGTLMFLIFGHIHFALFRSMKSALATSDWPAAGQRATRIASWVTVNFCLGWLAIGAVLFLS